MSRYYCYNLGGNQIPQKNKRTRSFNSVFLPLYPSGLWHLQGAMFCGKPFAGQGEGHSRKVEAVGGSRLQGPAPHKVKGTWASIFWFYPQIPQACSWPRPTVTSHGQQWALSRWVGSYVKEGPVGSQGGTRPGRRVGQGERPG